jgi:ABC-type multidrug transport system fused ATPase/permease subunit
MSSTVRNVVNVQKSLVDTQLMFDYLDEKPQILDAENAVNIKPTHPDITLDKVNFSYKKEETINNLTLHIPGGSTLAIVGKSGSGKSTLVKLLLRLYEINSGEIKIDGKNIQKIHQRSLRENISTVMQDSIVFNDTAHNNILYGKHTATKRDVDKAATLAGANKFIESLPNKYNTILGEKGVKLSGGEQQRINIARAFLKNAPILILDEATSSLDSEIEQQIQDSMWDLAKNRTTIIIAHRLSTVMKADLIVVMDKGKIVEQGTHKDLVEHKGIYSKLFEIQSGGYLK